MTIRMLMVNLHTGRSNTKLLTLAGDLAARFDAGVVGVASCQLMQSLYNDGYACGELIDMAQRTAQNDLKEAEAQFRALIEKRLGSVDWRCFVGFDNPADYVARQARCADVIVTGFPSRDTLGVDIGDLILQAGRPVLSIPENVAGVSFAHAIVAWKDAPEARRAAAAALPFLKHAGRVSVIEMAGADDMEAAQMRVQDVVSWLARHAVRAEAIAAAAESNETQAFATLAKTRGADLIVAGAYGHSRLREWVLGGFTHYLLNESGICSLAVH